MHDKICVCKKCSKQLNPNERVKIENSLYHKGCGIKEAISRLIQNV